MVEVTRRGDLGQISIPGLFWAISRNPPSVPLSVILQPLVPARFPWAIDRIPLDPRSRKRAYYRLRSSNNAQTTSTLFPRPPNTDPAKIVRKRSVEPRVALCPTVRESRNRNQACATRFSLAGSACLSYPYCYSWLYSPRFLSQRKLAEHTMLPP